MEVQFHQMVKFLKNGQNQYIQHQKQPPEMFIKTGVLKNSAKFTRKHLYQSLFLIKLQAEAEAWNFI